MLPGIPHKTLSVITLSKQFFFPRETFSIQTSPPYSAVLTPAELAQAGAGLTLCGKYQQPNAALAPAAFPVLL